MSRQLLMAIVLAAPLLAMGACARGSKEQAAERSLMRYAELPGLAATHHQGLQDELSRLRAEQATPKQLDAGRRRQFADRGVTASLEATVHPVDHKKVNWSGFFLPQSVAHAARRIDAVFPTGDAPLTPIQLTSIAAQQSRYAAQRERFDRLTDAADFHPGWLVSEGLAADTSFVEVARLDARLEGLLAIEKQQEGRLDAALAAIDRMFRIARILAAEPHLVSRLGAVHVRRDALSVLARILHDPACGSALRRSAMNRLASERDHWPPDRRAWIGDRAVGLHVYEMVRDGQLEVVLTEDERVRIRRTGSLDELQQAVQANVDADEMVYLRLMRRLIDACDRPYHERLEVLDAIEQELYKLRDSAEYPFVADTILLTDVNKAHRQQAIDRARMDAWLLALRAATGGAPKTPPLNPLTGEPFRLSVQPSRILVEGLDPSTSERVVIPLAPAD